MLERHPHGHSSISIVLNDVGAPAPDAAALMGRLMNGASAKGICSAVAQRDHQHAAVEHRLAQADPRPGSQALGHPPAAATVIRDHGRGPAKITCTSAGLGTL
jgi:hypothetical protein